MTWASTDRLAELTAYSQLPVKFQPPAISSERGRMFPIQLICFFSMDDRESFAVALFEAIESSRAPPKGRILA